jgi:hypothetical protein
VSNSNQCPPQKRVIDTAYYMGSMVCENGYEDCKLSMFCAMLISRATLLAMTATLESNEWYCRINAFLPSHFSCNGPEEDNEGPRMAEMMVALLEFWRKKIVASRVVLQLRCCKCQDFAARSTKRLPTSTVR